MNRGRDNRWYKVMSSYGSKEEDDLRGGGDFDIVHNADSDVVLIPIVCRTRLGESEVDLCRDVVSHRV